MYFIVRQLWKFYLFTGDRIQFIATRAPKHILTQWVASQIAVFVSKELDYNL
jgi:hypothetical protein